MSGVLTILQQDFLVSCPNWHGTSVSLEVKSFIYVIIQRPAITGHNICLKAELLKENRFWRIAVILFPFGPFYSKKFKTEI